MNFKKLNTKFDTLSTKLLDANRRSCKENKTIDSASTETLVTLLMSSRKSRRWLKRELKKKSRK